MFDGRARTLFVCLFAAAAAFVLGVKSRPVTSSPPAAVDTCKDFDETKRKLQEISETEYQEYLKLKDSPEKARKAEALLSKIMMLFLADMGLKLQGLPKASATPAAAPPNQEPPPASAQASDRKKKTPDKVPARPWVASEAAVTTAPSERDAVQASKNTEISNLFDELKASGPLNPVQIAAINGTYTGEVTFTDGSPMWSVEWNVDVQFESGELRGKYDVKLSKDGVVFSHTNGDGIQRDITSAKDSAAIFVKANGDQGFFQLYPVDRIQGMVGSFYIRKGFDQYIPTGTVVLRKQR